MREGVCGLPAEGVGREGGKEGRRKGVYYIFCRRRKEGRKECRRDAH